MSHGRSSHTSQKIAVLRRRLNFLREQQAARPDEVNGYRAGEIHALAWVLEALSADGCTCEPGEDPCFTCRVHGVVVARQQLDAKNVAVKAAVNLLRSGIKESKFYNSMSVAHEAMLAAIDAFDPKGEVSDVRE